MTEQQKIGLIAGGGKLPQYVRVAAQEAGTLGAVIALDPFANPTEFPESEPLRLGQFGKMIRRLKKANCTHARCLRRFDAH